MTKRANGEGSIRTRTNTRKDGSSYTRYAAVITTECNSKKQKRLEGSSRKSKEEALQDLEKLKKAQLNAIEKPLNLSLAEYLDYWLSQIKPKSHLQFSRKQLAMKTFKGYRHDVEAFIKPKLGYIRLPNLKPIPIQNWQDQLELSHGPYVAKNASATLSSALSKAVVWRLLEYSPYEKGAISKVIVPRYEADYWEPSEMSELRGLMWQDVVHLQNRRTRLQEPHIYVQRQAINDCQNRSFQRVLKQAHQIDLFPYQALLTPYSKNIRYSKKIYTPIRPATLVTNKSGGIPTSGHLRNEFYALCDKARVRRTKFHGLRHTAGSLWIKAGISLLRASRWLGHSHMRTTEKIYIHLLREASYGDSISLEKMLKINPEWK